MQQTLEELSLETFQANVNYFFQNHKEIYHKLASLDSAIEEGSYISQYDLVIVEDNYDIKNIQTQEYIYDSKSAEYAQSVAKSISFKHDENVFETFKKFPLDLLEERFVDLSPTLKYIDKNRPQPALMKQIEKFLFFGVGLGTHIQSVHEKIHAKAYFIIEDNLELFKLSLFTMPYYKLANEAKLFFSIFDTKEEFVKPAQEFIDFKFYYNHYLKYFEMINHNEEKLKEFHLRVVSQSNNIFFYKDILTQYLQPLKYMKRKQKFLDLLYFENSTLFHDKPILLLAAGPSLQKNIAFVKANEKKFLIVALSSILNILEHEGIKPDIVTHMDGGESSLAHFEKLNSLAFLEDTTFLFSARIPEWVLENLNPEHIFFYENGTSYKVGIGNLSAACVGSTTYLLLLALGVQELYLLGLDLALDGKTGATHSIEHEFSQELDLEKADKHHDVMRFKESVVTTSGNHQESVFTTPEFMLSIESINASSLGFKKETQHVYNLSNGAYFKNTKPLALDSFHTDNFKQLNKESVKVAVLEEFTLHNSSQITEDERNLINARIKHAFYLKEVIEFQKELICNSDDEFLKSLIMLFKKLTSGTSSDAYDLSLIFQEYCKTIYTDIFDFFNTKELQNILIHVDMLNKTLTEALERIINEYIDVLKET